MNKNHFSAASASFAAFSSACFFFFAVAKSIDACFFLASFSALSFFFYAASSAASSFSFWTLASAAAFSAARLSISGYQAFGCGTIGLVSMKILTSSSVTFALLSWNSFNQTVRTSIKIFFISPVNISPLEYFLRMSSSYSSSSKKNVRY